MYTHWVIYISALGLMISKSTQHDQQIEHNLQGTSAITFDADSLVTSEKAVKSKTRRVDEVIGSPCGCPNQAGFPPSQFHPLPLS